ncbi:hypothetical protein CJ030_MR2G016375 [Morella rubra]|uniref:Uncharacterized protein n=1 Tax=Morella rubra TaxID=262757 RepID=A0A6A1WJ48_9ROSI|nr:hypothetical protein CJ030_MR2G016375 [Morella rubra]
MAVGIFPRDATNYEFNEETRKLTVYIRRFVKWATGTHLSCAFSPLLLGIWRKLGRKTRSREAYEVLRDGITVDKF